MGRVLAIDIGGTKLAAALVDADGSAARSATRPTPRTEVMAALAGLIGEVVGDGPAPLAVGIGCAGPINLADGTVSPVNMPSWRQYPLRDEVRELTGAPAVLAGDAQCFALGEHWLGSGRGSSALLGIVVSTGIGGGLVIDGAPLLGPTGNAGHVGHMTIDPYGELCECGGRGCVERYASGPNLAHWALANGWKAPEGEPADARTLAAGAARGEPVPVAAFERGARALAGMIASTAAAVEVTRVVIGGGVSAAGPVLFEPLDRALDEVAGLAFVRAVEVKPTTLGVRAALAGAARLAWDHHGATR
ncbi:ROK family protein [Nonomuraea sp. SMC257]|uniref:ROK family protein n=1 Tax=Nonomuraea montanisoli TaxID=2741721 RepID=A0A7Y6I4G5_9ACTN|nr:ROK family protein [Nonomuraea montanisoli]NUW30339.1 ROK family protein [Nonomuraea montanisoli]